MTNRTVSMQFVRLSLAEARKRLIADDIDGMKLALAQAADDLQNAPPDPIFKRTQDRIDRINRWMEHMREFREAIIDEIVNAESELSDRPKDST